jgi:hypothetical protein
VSEAGANWGTDTISAILSGLLLSFENERF